MRKEIKFGLSEAPEPSKHLENLGRLALPEIYHALTQKALRGDLRAASLLAKTGQSCTSRPLDLGGLETAEDLVSAQKIVTRAAASGDISPTDAKRLGEQLAHVGEALERHELSTKIDEMRTIMGTTREAKFNASIAREVDDMEKALNGVLKKKEANWDKSLREFGNNIDEYHVVSHAVAAMRIICGFDNDAFFEIAFDRLLPRALQELFDVSIDLIEPQSRDQRGGSRLYSSRGRRPKRWAPDNWHCGCKGQSTLWCNTDLPISDPLQIYCSNCKKLVGWGTREDFERSHSEGYATLIKPSDADLMTELKPQPTRGMAAYLRERKIGTAAYKSG